MLTLKGLPQTAMDLRSETLQTRQEHRVAPAASWPAQRGGSGIWSLLPGREILRWSIQVYSFIRQTDRLTDTLYNIDSFAPRPYPAFQRQHATVKIWAEPGDEATLLCTWHTIRTIYIHVIVHILYIHWYTFTHPYLVRSPSFQDQVS